MANGNHQISLQTAIDLTTRYRANKAADAPVCETFELQSVNQLLAVEGCAFLRIYYGMDENMEVHAILVAANAAEEDILPGTALEASGAQILEDAFRCPPRCPAASPLNS